MKIEIAIAKPQRNREPRWLKFQALLLALILLLAFVPRSQADTGNCNGQPISLPFTDVMGSFAFCFIAQIYFQGITAGTGPSTYSPASNVTREQMAVFLARTQNSTLNRGSQRAALNQFWTTTPQYTITQGVGMLGTTTVGENPSLLASDGVDLWIANNGSSNVSRVRGSDGRLLETWPGTLAPDGVLVALGRIFVVGNTNPGRLYVINPSQTPGAATELSNGLGVRPHGIAFDGQRIWTANDGSVSIITPGAPFTVTNVPGFGDLSSVVYDGANVWVTEDGSPGQLKRLDATGAVVDTVTVGNTPTRLIFDGTNLWVPNFNSASVSVVRPADGAVLATLTGNGLNRPASIAFDGQRILVTNLDGHSVSLFRATDFSPLGNFSTGAGSTPFGACSDGGNFWITLSGPDKLARF